jgi:hypothetical protein
MVIQSTAFLQWCPPFTLTHVWVRDGFMGMLSHWCIARLKPDGTRSETRFRLSPKRTSPFKSAGASVQLTTSSRVVRISGSNAGYTTFRGRVKSTGYPLHSPVSTSLPLPCVTLCHQVSNEIYHYTIPESLFV